MPTPTLANTVIGTGFRLLQVFDRLSTEVAQNRNVQTLINLNKTSVFLYEPMS